MNKKWISLNPIVPAAAWVRACGLAAAVMMLAAGPASASYTGTPITITPLWDNTVTTLGALQTEFNDAFSAVGVTATIGANAAGVGGAVVGNTSTYDADGNVVGTVSNSGTVSAYTLSNYTGSDFLQNISEPAYGQPVTNSFTITFSTALDLHNMSFDYEIFPNYTCTVEGTNCGGSGNPDLPSLNVTDTYLNSSGTSQSALIFQRYATVPGVAFSGAQGAVTNPDQPLPSCSGETGKQKDCGGGGAAVTTASTTTYNGTPGFNQATDLTDHSPNTGAQVTSTKKNGKTTYAVKSTTDKETAPQLLGTSGNVSVTVGKGVTSLTFNDWPATIAISQISFQVPEPNSWSLIVPGLILLGLLGRRTATGRLSKRTSADQLNVL